MPSFMIVRLQTSEIKKPNNNPIYVHSLSNHPPSTLKQLPKSINKRLNDISCNQETFDAAKGEYEKALRNSGYSDTLEYVESANETSDENTTRACRAP